MIGVDHDPAMFAEARRRTSGMPAVQIREGDAHACPPRRARHSGPGQSVICSR
ncbi:MULTISPECIES: hypothetical protein [Streptomyces]|uniref:Methyltransferase domain-containing protein n=2 Tax=Streptomyces TaxID=1883 RepID=A0ABV9J641_9ACTN